MISIVLRCVDQNTFRGDGLLQTQCFRLSSSVTEVQYLSTAFAFLQTKKFEGRHLASRVLTFIPLTLEGMSTLQYSLILITLPMLLALISNNSFLFKRFIQPLIVRDVVLTFSNRSAPDWGKWCGPSVQEAWTVHHVQIHTHLGHSPLGFTQRGGVV